MKTTKVKIVDKELTLFERKAKDVLDLADFLKNVQHSNEISNINVFVGMQILLASLRPNLYSLKWYEIIKKWRLKKFISYEHLLQNISVAELDELVTSIYLLEGIDTKKKVVEAERQ